MNCSLILEESIRNNKDSNVSTHIVVLDPKSAFGVVSHASLMRKSFHIGIEGNHWNLIYSLHSDAHTAVNGITDYLIVLWFNKESVRGDLEHGPL